MLKILTIPEVVTIEMPILPGVTFECRPPTTALVEQARAEARRAVTDDPRDGATEEAYTLAMLKAAVISWTGVADQDGQPAPVTEANLAAFSKIHPFAGLWRSEYLSSLVEKFLEGEGCAPSPSGTVAGVRNTAEGAENQTSHAPGASV
ncbi:MAG: hypothetical protein ABT940_07255 [Alphaproteobacteria bacterium]